ncbi:hypothetical protein HA052_26650 [Chromobacterium haemolyticum]|uniref:Uncharacterized protein n=1 Tax=Chromobacterium fluminis TaxID=3044269 RepID=A0ABX0LH11_9NEIS|nr:hypothetical protein [Chromobacterium haemolyticum]NHR08772.1 hypothetical protein [Chromobacterium haemolyticum]
MLDRCFGVIKVSLNVFMRHFFKVMFFLNFVLTGVGGFFVFHYGGGVCLGQYGATSAIVYSSAMILSFNVLMCIFYFSFFKVAARLPLGRVGVIHLLVAMLITVVVASPFFKGVIDCPAKLMQHNFAVIFIVFVILEQAFLFCFFATMVAFSCVMRRGKYGDL